MSKPDLTPQILALSRMEDPFEALATISQGSTPEGVVRLARACFALAIRMVGIAAYMLSSRAGGGAAADRLAYGQAATHLKQTFDGLASALETGIMHNN